MDELAAFEELSMGSPPPARQHLEGVDVDILKIAAVLAPSDPFPLYEQLGGTYAKCAAVKGAGGLRSSVKLFDHQEEAVKKVLAKDGSLLLSHPVGSGKTLTAIAAFEALRAEGKASRALVVAPASLRTNFVENGIKKFTTARAAIFGNAQEAAAGSHVSTDTPDPHARYHVVSYELFRTDPKRYIDAAGADTIIYDELHRAKNEGVLTSKAIKDARQHHRNFIGLTGSIVSNTPADVVPLVDAMTDGQHLLGNKTIFESRFVRVNNDGSKALHAPQVLKALLAPYVHHVDPQRLNTQAPAKAVEEVHVEMGAHQTQLYRYVLGKLDPLTKFKLKAGMSHLSGAELNDMFAKLLRLRQVSNAVHTLDTRVSIEESAEKTPKIKRILDDVQEHIRETPDAQVVIHTNLIQGGVDVLTAGLKQRGIDHALFIGKGNAGVTEKGRQQGVKEFQEGKKRVIVLSAAGGEGLDLPNTTFMAMADGHFNPEKTNQAEARGVRAGGQAHRPADQRRVVVRRYMSVLPNDAGRKVEVLANIWDNISPKNVTQRLATGAAPFYNPFTKTPSTDEWVYSIAKGKGALNAGVHNLIKSAGVSTGTPRTHEEAEAVLAACLTKVGMSDMAVGALSGAALGAGWGALVGGTGVRSKEEAALDPHAAVRNRIGSIVGGAVTGGIAGLSAKDALNATAAGAGFAPIMGLLTAGSLGPLHGRNVADLLAPVRGTPRSAQELLGKTLRPSDKALFEKYWDQFGTELEEKGMRAPVSDEKLEAKFVTALRDLYHTAGSVAPSLKEQQVRGGGLVGKMKPIPSKTKYLATHVAGNVAGATLAGLASAGGAIVRDNKSRALAQGTLSAVPALIGGLASTAKTYRDMYIDPRVEVALGRGEVRKRAKFTDEQLQQLLRGLPVEEIKVKRHFIK